MKYLRSLQCQASIVCENEKFEHALCREESWKNTKIRMSFWIPFRKIRLRCTLFGNAWTSFRRKSLLLCRPSHRRKIKSNLQNEAAVCKSSARVSRTKTSPTQDTQQSQPDIWATEKSVHVLPLLLKGYNASSSAFDSCIRRTMVALDSLSGQDVLKVRLCVWKRG